MSRKIRAIARPPERERVIFQYVSSIHCHLLTRAGDRFGTPPHTGSNPMR
jgi:hypothetical protein